MPELYGQVIDIELGRGGGLIYTELAGRAARIICQKYVARAGSQLAANQRANQAANQQDLAKIRKN